MGVSADLDPNIEIAVRKAAMRAARADAARTTTEAVAAMAAGAGAELVARQQRARDVLATRLEKTKGRVAQW